jgi:AcrR family transcriptional regulator
MARTADPYRKQDILAAAGQVFAQKGYASARIIDVARAAGVGKGTIYEYFRSKEDLFFAVFEEVMATAARELSAAAMQLDGSFQQRMQVLSDGMIRSWLDQLEMYALVMEFWAATASSPSRRQFKAAFQDGYRQLRRVVGDVIEDAQRRGEISARADAVKTASALIGTWDALLLQAWLDPGFDALGTSQAFLDVVVRGLAPVSPG